MFSIRLIAASFLLLPHALHARDIQDELSRAEAFGRQAPGLISRDRIKIWWSQDGGEIVYRVNTDRPDTSEFIRMDASTGAKTPAFDHKRIAASLSQATGGKVKPGQLPIDFIKLPRNSPMIIGTLGKSWEIARDGLSIKPTVISPDEIHLQTLTDARRSAGASGNSTSLTLRNVTGGTVEYFWSPEPGEKISYGTIAAGKSATISTYAGHLWILEDEKKRTLGAVRARDLPAIARITDSNEKSGPSRNLSPDGKWLASLTEHNVFIEPSGGGDKVALTTDGSEEIPYREPFHWSPDSSKLIARHDRKVEVRKIHIVQSSPPGQLQPKRITFDYPKPGDEIEQPKPRLFDIASRRQITLDDSLYPNPWKISDVEWADDSSAFSFVYNARGHQTLRLIRIRASDGSARAIIEETSPTFIDYSQKLYLHRLPATKELLWASERSGFNHLYLVDEETGEIKSTVTTGPWNVRKVIAVDARQRTLILQVAGTTPSNPYYSQFVRINFDGGGTIPLTEADGDHTIEFSPDGKSLVDTWSRVDQPPVRELRDSATGKQIAVLEKADDSRLRSSGWSPPERFTAKGRDDATDIHGIIIRPRNFDPTRKYPVVEDIYAGPHDHFVPTRYSPWSHRTTLAELGFIIVKIDGMGTNWRGKKFHDIAWKNLRDSGFPDRIAWMKAAASTRPWMDLSRVGIFGGSAGGQSALAGLLHHGDFYKAAVADCGCHDNRMDKIWWNEAWLGWPVDESYAENSNVVHAAKLTGRLMLIVGEMDRNVDPASTYQVAAALQKAGKEFEFVPIMNTGHGAAETPYGKWRRARFLVDSLSPPLPGSP